MRECALVEGLPRVGGLECAPAETQAEGCGAGNNSAQAEQGRDGEGNMGVRELAETSSDCGEPPEPAEVSWGELEPKCMAVASVVAPSGERVHGQKLGGKGA